MNMIFYLNKLLKKDIQMTLLAKVQLSNTPTGPFPFDPMHNQLATRILKIVKTWLGSTLEWCRIDRDLKQLYNSCSPRNALLIGLKGFYIFWPVYTVHKCGLQFLLSMMISSVAIKYILSNFCTSDSYRSLSDLFPLHKALPSIILGVMFGCTDRYLHSHAVNMALQGLQYFKITPQFKQDIAGILNGSGLFNILSQLLVCIFIPILEERIFRGAFLESALTHLDNKPKGQNLSLIERAASIGKKAIAIIGTSFVFGLLHITYGQGWGNAPIFVKTFLMGIGYSLLKVTTGNLWACTTAHIFNNTVAAAHLGGIVDIFSLENRLFEVLKNNKTLLFL
jgi:membrane protease YdiL (CAAX protease family)